jgi:hypothetical protein
LLNSSSAKSGEACFISTFSGGLQVLTITITIAILAVLVSACSAISEAIEIEGSFRINDGARYTDIPDVLLHIEAEPTPSEMLIAENSRFDGANWIPFRG